jgi:hypothetical protein
VWEVFEEVENMDCAAKIVVYRRGFAARANQAAVLAAARGHFAEKAYVALTDGAKSSGRNDWLELKCGGCMSGLWRF